ncbi:T9SS type A sorting domain-containing protein, partial [candidate division KSB1 bacterium]|nr:T9SS type A sorting domain-containing protein [candidate division KSB1 bacterium]
ACDDYLHQAADSTNWPEGLTYDPENDGTPLGSLGVHEHWNDPISKNYSRNLGTGNGIELIKLFEKTQVVETSHDRVRTFELYQNYPNPFNAATTIFFDLRYSAQVQLSITDVLGRNVKKLLDTEISSGRHKITWDATNENNEPVAAGVYWCRMQTEDYAEQKKLVLLK